MSLAIAVLVSYRPCFQIGCIVHRFIGRETQVMEDEHEIGAYMFRRTVPSVHLTAEDVRLMVGTWRDRIIIFTGRQGVRSKNPSGIDILNLIEGWSADRQQKAYEIIARFEKEGIDRLQIMPGASELCRFLDSKKISKNKSEKEEERIHQYEGVNHLV